MVDWTKKNIVPKHELEAWHQYEPGVSGHEVIGDYSGNGRIISTAITNPPVLQANVLNGQPGWYFNGSRDPLSWSGSLTWKHIFILASAEDAAFSTNRGLLSGVTTGNALVSNASGDIFFNLGIGSAYQYRKSGVAFAEANQKAPMSGDAQVLELVHTTGMAMDGIRLGQHFSLAGRLWKGWFFDHLMYSGVKNDLARFNIYRYFAMRYWVWERTAAGLFVFPFAANKNRGTELGQETYFSEPYAGDPKALTRGTFEGSYELPFLLREQEEYLAAEAFYKQHWPLDEFVYRDYRFYPYRDVICRFASPLREQGSDVTYRFNYSFEVVEVS